MRIAIGADHAGYDLKSHLVSILTGLDHTVIDLGTDGTTSVDYPGYCAAVGRAVARGDAERGIVLGGSGQGEQIAANKVAGVRAVTAHDSYSVERSVKSNDAQVLTLGQRVIGLELARKLVGEWLDHRFDPSSPSAAKVEAICGYDGSLAEEPAPGGCG